MSDEDGERAERQWDDEVKRLNCPPGADREASLAAGHEAMLPPSLRSPGWNPPSGRVMIN